MRSVDGDRRWRLPIDVRAEPPPEPAAAPDVAPAVAPAGPPTSARKRTAPPELPEDRAAAAETLVRETFARPKGPPDPKLVPVRLMTS